jgi:predicted dehydrogenase
MQSFPKRFDPVSHYLREQVNSGALGRISLVRIRHGHYYGLDPEFRKRWYVRSALAGGGALLDEGIHGADLLAWLFDLPDRVSAVVSHAALGLEVEDLGIATFSWASGLVAELTASFCFAAADVSIELYGSAGTLLVSGVDLASRDITHAGFVRLYRNGSEPRQWQTIGLTPRFKIGQFHHQNALAFLGALDGDAPAPITVDDGLRAQRMIAAAYRAAAEARCLAVE